MAGAEARRAQRHAYKISSQWQMLSAIKALLTAAKQYHSDTTTMAEHTSTKPVQRLSLIRRIRLHMLISGARTRSKSEMKALRHSLVSLFSVLVTLMYIPISEVALRTLQCEQHSDGIWRMKSTAEIECWNNDPKWIELMPGSVGVIILWVIGVPLFFFCLLYSGYRLGEGQNFLWYKAANDRGMQDPEFEARWGALYLSYNHGNCLWEVTVMVKKVSLIFLQGAIRMPTLQLSGVTMVLTTMLALQLSYRPYSSRVEHRLELFSTVNHVMVVLASAIFMSDALDPNGLLFHGLVAFVILNVVVALATNALVLLFNLKLVGEAFSDSPLGKTSICRTIVRCFGVCFRFPVALIGALLRLILRVDTDDLRTRKGKMQLDALAKAQVMFGVDCAKDLRPWLQRCSRTQLATSSSRSMPSPTTRTSSSLFAPSDDAKLTTTRLLRFFAGAPREKSDTRASCSETCVTSSRAQPVRAVSREAMEHQEKAIRDAGRRARLQPP